MARRLTVTQLTPASFLKAPVWEYTNQDETSNVGELAVRPVSELPVRDTRNRELGVDVRLADGSVLPAMLANLDARDATSTQHFLAASLWTGEQWFHLARYHDITYKRDGPGALAAALGRTVADIFPIAYDVTEIVDGDSAALRGEIVAEPTERLSRAELIARAVRSG
jgi:hypothetical protein